MVVVTGSCGGEKGRGEGGGTAGRSLVVIVQSRLVTGELYFGSQCRRCECCEVVAPTLSVLLLLTRGLNAIEPYSLQARRIRKKKKEKKRGGERKKKKKKALGPKLFIAASLRKEETNESDSVRSVKLFRASCCCCFENPIAVAGLTRDCPH